MTPRPRSSRNAAIAHLRPLVRRVNGRDRINALLDAVRLRIDTFPDGLYQPVPGLPDRVSHRRAGTESRWHAIHEVIRRIEISSAVDIGANTGYFALALGRLGIPTLAIEAEPASHRTATLAVRRSECSNVGTLLLALDPITLALLPHADAVLLLAVWHHLVRAHGLDTATTMLEQIWSRTGRVLFFETGPLDTARHATDPAWIEDMLRACCPSGQLEPLGQHAAADGNSSPRHLYAVIRRLS